MFCVCACVVWCALPKSNSELHAAKRATAEDASNHMFGAMQDALSVMHRERMSLAVASRAIRASSTVAGTQTSPAPTRRLVSAAVGTSPAKPAAVGTSPAKPATATATASASASATTATATTSMSTSTSTSTSTATGTGTAGFATPPRSRQRRRARLTPRSTQRVGAGASAGAGAGVGAGVGVGAAGGAVGDDAVGAEVMSPSLTQGTEAQAELKAYAQRLKELEARLKAVEAAHHQAERRGSSYKAKLAKTLKYMAYLEKDRNGLKAKVRAQGRHHDPQHLEAGQQEQQELQQQQLQPQHHHRHHQHHQPLDRVNEQVDEVQGGVQQSPPQSQQDGDLAREESPDEQQQQQQQQQQAARRAPQPFRGPVATPTTRGKETRGAAGGGGGMATPSYSAISHNSSPLTAGESASTPGSGGQDDVVEATPAAPRRRARLFDDVAAGATPGAREGGVVDADGDVDVDVDVDVDDGALSSVGSLDGESAGAMDSAQQRGGATALASPVGPRGVTLRLSSPKWVPDSQASECSGCAKAFFMNFGKHVRRYLCFLLLSRFVCRFSVHDHP